MKNRKINHVIAEYPLQRLATLHYFFAHFFGRAMLLLRVHAPCFIAACLTLSATASATEPADMERLGASVFRIEAHDRYGRMNSGTAVMVATRTLVTSCHVVMHARDISVRGATGHAAARVVRAHAERDLCLLDAPDLAGDAVTLGNTTDKRAGQPIRAAGYPLGAPLTWSHGSIVALFSIGGDGRVVQGSAIFNPGASGGGLFDGDGRLVAILTFKLRASGPYHFAVPVEWLVSLMQDASATTPAFSDKPFWQHTDERQPVFLRAASLFADGDCAGLNTLTMQRLARDPENSETLQLVKRARQCSAPAQARHPVLERLFAARFP